MRRLQSWLIRLAGVFGAGRRDRDIENELRAHRDMAADEHVRSGMSPEAARRRAAAEFGSIAAASEAYRDRRGLPSLEGLVRDARMAVRSLARTPVLSASMILVLGLGIGVATALAAVFHTVVWDTLPVPQAERMVQLALRFDGEVNRRVQGNRTRFSYPEIQTYRRTTRALSALAASTTINVGWRDERGARGLHGTLVAGDFFAVMAATPAWGRTLTIADAAQPVAVISHDLWSSAFASSPGVLGQTMSLDGLPFVIVGVAPRWLSSLWADQPASSFWLPLEAWHSAKHDTGRLTEANLGWLQGMGRLADAASISSARTEAALMASGFDRDYPGRRTTIEISRASRIDRAGFRTQVLTAGGAISVFIVLLFLICGSNAAALLLARGASRQKEIAVRLALGASRLRVVRQLAVEIAGVASASALIGIGIAIASLHQLAVHVPMKDVLLGIQPDARVFGFAFGVALLVALLFGLAPARQVLSVDCLENLKGDASFGGCLLPAMRLRRLLIAVQVAISVPLLVIAMLFSRAVSQAWRADPGFDTAGLYAIEPNMASLSSSTAFVDWLRAVPGVLAVGRTLVAPFFGLGSSQAGTDPARLSERVHFSKIDDGYFPTLGVRIVAGRTFLPHEDDAVIVNTRLARRLWADDGAAIGQVLFVPGPPTATEASRPLRVVGVVPTLQTTTLGVPDEPTYYMPLDEARASFMWILVRTDPRAALQGVIADETRRTYSELSTGVLEIDARMQDATRPARVASAVLGSIGLLALVVAAVGVHGVVALTVAARTRDIGVYRALGAGSTQLVRLVVGWTLSGVAMGAAGALSLLLLVAVTLRRQLLPLFNGVSPLDLPSFAVGLAVLTVVIGVAAYFPARRALGMTPLAALRHE